MSLSPAPTLGEIRQEVLIRCGMATTGTLPQDQQQVVDSKIRSAQRQLFTNSWWSRIRQRTDIALITGTSIYDWPDAVSPETITDVQVVRLSDGKEYRVDQGIRSHERNTASTSTNSCPTQFEYIDGTIKLYPAPDAAVWGLLRITSYGDIPAFIDDAERTVVDPEALIQFAELLLKQHYEMPGVGGLEKQLEKYLGNIRARQSTKEGLSLTGRQSILMRPKPDNRIARNRGGGAGVGDDWASWTPWGG